MDVEITATPNLSPIVRDMDVTLYCFGNKGRVSQRRHVLGARNECVPTLRNTISKNLCHSSVRNRGLIAGHHKYREGQSLKVFEGSWIRKAATVLSVTERKRSLCGSGKASQVPGPLR